MFLIEHRHSREGIYSPYSVVSSCCGICRARIEGHYRESCRSRGIYSRVRHDVPLLRIRIERQTRQMFGVVWVQHASHRQNIVQIEKTNSPETGESRHGCPTRRETHFPLPLHSPPCSTNQKIGRVQHSSALFCLILSHTLSHLPSFVPPNNAQKRGPPPN